MKVWI